MNRFVIIVAGGSGQRMESNVPKQFLTINNEVILIKTIRAFYTFDNKLEIVLALPLEHIPYWENICAEHNFDINHTIVQGGKTRFHSVKNALEAIGEKGVVAIHDGVRPLVNHKTIETIFTEAEQNGNAIPCIDLVDSIRLVEKETNQPVNRDKYKLIQTPQAFDCSIIKEAYKQNWHESFTDDASVVEKLGININLVPGNRENIKITSKTDLIIAEAFSNYLLE